MRVAGGAGEDSACFTQLAESEQWTVKCQSGKESSITSHISCIASHLPAYSRPHHDLTPSPYSSTS